ncbi:SDR family NAD(P)-dependent oxidoreductase [Streptomyces rhizosphaericus]|uniref:SDR family oxidoreductase n=1 Tax=Streptomyces rhizosphaericus TaxID=114699 RepID=A0A6G4AT98_9ACTN|nr:SDR family oxidoreductase [Streptomyces rhizosphaericus]NEW76478.1 SDR family oxidoreductase [Streptomyces rhizosphaericus]
MVTILGRPGTVVVTGGASGIGLATVERLLDGVADRCAVLDLRPDREVVGRLAERFGTDRISALACDVADQDAVAGAVDRLAQAGPIAGLVNCAGTLLAKPSLDITLADLHRLFDVHVAGSLFAAQAVARTWIARNEPGAIVNLSSVASSFGWPGRLPYPIAKTGTEAMTRTLAVEWARWRIRVNAVAPGTVDSPLMAEGRRPPGVKPIEEVVDRHALGRAAAPSEIADAITFLLSESSSFMTGAVVPVDGGFTITKDSAKELTR